MPVSATAVEQLRLAAQEREVPAVPGLAAGAFGGEARALAQDHDRDVRAAGCLDGLRDLPVRAGLEVRAPGVAHLGVRQSRTQRVEHGGHARQLIEELEMERRAVGTDAVAPVALEERLDMRDVGVVADERPSVVGVGPDDRERPQAGPQRQHRALVAQQHDGAASHLRGDRPVVVIGHLGQPLVHVGPLEQAEAELGRQDAADRQVHQLHGHSAVIDGHAQWRAEGRGARQLHVQAGFQRQPRRVGQVRREPMPADQLVHARVVADHDAVEAPPLAQDGRQELP